MWWLRELFGHIGGDEAAVSQANATWWATIVGFLAFIANTVIALVAIRGPERERHVRDFEDRKRRARLEIRAAWAALEALTTQRRLIDRISAPPGLKGRDSTDLKMFKRRLLTRIAVLDHFLNLDLRAGNLVGWMNEAKTYLKALHDGIDEKATQFAEDPYKDAALVIEHRKERMDRLRKKLQAFAGRKRAKDASLQRDISEVTKIWWYVKFWWRPRTSRD